METVVHRIVPHAQGDLSYNSPWTGPPIGMRSLSSAWEEKNIAARQFPTILVSIFLPKPYGNQSSALPDSSAPITNHPSRIYLDRTLGRDRDHRDFGRDAFARTQSSQTRGKTGCLSEQSQATESDVDDVL